MPQGRLLHILSRSKGDIAKSRGNLVRAQHRKRIRRAIVKHSKL